MRKLIGLITLLVVIGVGASFAQVVVTVPPSCPFGYYDVPPYDCAPAGYYPPEYFYGGIFLGAGPWSNWGYSHGWGSHRYINRGWHQHYYPRTRGYVNPRVYSSPHGYSRGGGYYHRR